MRSLTVADVVFIHDDLVARYGGVGGIRDNGLLESAVFRCQATFGGDDLYPTVFDKAAALFHAIIFDHPFVDGNKRTAIGSAAIFLDLNGWVLVASKEDLVAFPLLTEKERPGLDLIAEWFRAHAVKKSR